jgi:hypothetical protein
MKRIKLFVDVDTAAAPSEVDALIREIVETTEYAVEEIDGVLLCTAYEEGVEDIV